MRQVLSVQWLQISPTHSLQQLWLLQLLKFAPQTLKTRQLANEGDKIQVNNQLHNHLLTNQHNLSSSYLLLVFLEA